MVSLTEAKAVNASYKPPYIPTAIFVGGTSGIGRAMAAHLARTTNGACKIIVIGRNPASAEALLASFPPPPPASGVTHEFVQCDVRLMKNVHATAGALKAQLRKVNFLVLSTGVLRLGGRRDTEEGVDEKLALIYYSRWAFVHDLMPLLEEAAGKGEEAKVMSVLAAGTPLCGEVDVDDLGMVRSYGGFKAMRVAPTYNDLMFEVWFRHSSWLLLRSVKTRLLVEIRRPPPKGVLHARLSRHRPHEHLLPHDLPMEAPQPPHLRHRLALQHLPRHMRGVHVVRAAYRGARIPSHG
ncbi:hypothetical protein FPV67DRAFT_1529566 [Lyophyllum atratum]|nr:hypothetical protein FPV67DRAFT_1529566 [Lyophyllum atratum]